MGIYSTKEFLMLCANQNLQCVLLGFHVTDQNKMVHSCEREGN